MRREGKRSEVVGSWCQLRAKKDHAKRRGERGGGLGILYFFGVDRDLSRAD